MVGAALHDVLRSDLPAPHPARDPQQGPVVLARPSPMDLLEAHAPLPRQQPGTPAWCPLRRSHAQHHLRTSNDQLAGPAPREGTGPRPRRAAGDLAVVVEGGRSVGHRVSTDVTLLRSCRVQGSGTTTFSFGQFELFRNREEPEGHGPLPQHPGPGTRRKKPPPSDPRSTPPTPSASQFLDPSALAPGSPR